jgi:hypothetical protein
MASPDFDGPENGAYVSPRIVIDGITVRQHQGNRADRPAHVRYGIGCRRFYRSQGFGFTDWLEASSHDFLRQEFLIPRIEPARPGRNEGQANDCGKQDKPVSLWRVFVPEFGSTY